MRQREGIVHVASRPAGLSLMKVLLVPKQLDPDLKLQLLVDGPLRLPRRRELPAELELLNHSGGHQMEPFLPSSLFSRDVQAPLYKCFLIRHQSCSLSHQKDTGGIAGA